MLCAEVPLSRRAALVQVIHRDIKSPNLLIDRDFHLKVFMGVCACDLCMVCQQRCGMLHRSR